MSEIVRSDVVKKMSASAVGAGLGLVVAGPAGALAGASAPALVEALLMRKSRLGARNTEHFIAGLTALTGMTQEEVDRWCADDESRIQLVTSALRAAYWTAVRQTIDALSSVVAAAIDDGKLDTGQLIIDALAELGGAHIRVLLSFYTDTPVLHPDGEIIAEGAWSEFQLASRHPNLADAMPVLMTKLERCGLVEESTLATNLGRCWMPTSFGPLCIKYLRAWPSR